MYNLEWRVAAKVVAIIELVFVVMQLLMIVISSAAAVAISENSESDSYIALPEEVVAMSQIIWFGVPIMGLYAGVSLWAVVQLVHATELGQELKEAYRRSRNWQYVHITLVVLSIVGMCSNTMTTSLIWIAIANLLTRISFMYVVYRFMRNIQVAATPIRHEITCCTIVYGELK